MTGEDRERLAAERREEQARAEYDIAGRKFRDACRLLREVSAAGFHLYLANDTLNLMAGPSHDDHGKAQRDLVLDSEIIPGASGGDW